MKTIFKVFVPAAVAVAALASCQSEKDQTPVEKGQVHISVIATPQEFANQDTKTYIGSDGEHANAILWGTGEYMKLAIKAGTSTTFGVSSESSANQFNGQPTATFEFNINPGTASTYTYMGLYPNSAADEDEGNVDPEQFVVNLPITQAATSSSYDPAAYIMVAEPISSTEVLTQWMASYRRATALNKVTLKNLPAGVISVEFTAIKASEDADDIEMAGSRLIDLTTGDSGAISEGSNKVTVNYATALDAGNQDIWFTSWDTEIPAGAKLAIVAKTADKAYAREITARTEGILFKEGYLNTLSVNMESAAQGPLDGTYVILARKGSAAPYEYFAMKGEASGTRIASIDYTGSLDSYGGDGSIIWNIESSGASYTIKNNGNYVGWTSGNSADLVAENDFDADQCLMNITLNSDETTYAIAVKSSTTRILARNTSNAYFAFYTGTQYKDLILVPATVDTRTPVTLAFESETAEFTDAAGSYDQFSGYNVTATDDESNDITANISDALVWAYVDEDGIIDEFDNGALTLTGEIGTATVTVFFPGNVNYLPAAEVSYTITVTSSVVDYSELETSNVTLSTTGGTNAYPATVNGNDAVKGGKSGGAGAVVINVPANTTNLHVHAAGWTGETVVLSITGATANPNVLNLTSNPGISGNSPFTLSSGTNNDYSTDPADYYFNIELSNITEDTNITFTATSGLRFVIWGVNAEQDNTNWGLSSIAVKTPPTKLVYEAGENFDPTGLVINAIYVDADDQTGTPATKTVEVAYTSQNADDFAFSPTQFLTASESQSVTITYGGKTTTQLVSVSAPTVWTLDGIAVKTAPTKTTYMVGENFNPAGLVLTATYVDAASIKDPKTEDITYSTETASDFSFNPSTSTPLTVSHNKVTITYGGKSVDQTIIVNAPTTIADVIDGGGSGSFSVENVTVFAVTNTSTAIIGDATGKVLFYKNNHGLAAGDVVTVSGSTTLYNGVVEFTTVSGVAPTATKTGTTTVDHGDAITLTSTNLTNWQSAPEIVYVTGSGSQSGRYITVEGVPLYLNTTYSETDGKDVNFTGYLYGWYTSGTPNSFSFYPTVLTVDDTTPTISVSPSSLDWAATEYGSENAKTLTVTLNGASNAGDYSVLEVNSDWTVSDDENGTITVYPNAENTDTANPKSITLTIAHDDDPDVYQEIVCTQAKATGDGPVDVSGPWATWGSTSAFTVSSNTVNSKVSTDFCGTNATLKAFNSSGTAQSLTAGNAGSGDSAFYFVYFSAASSSYWQIDLPVTEDIPSGTTINISYYHAVNSKGITSWTVKCNNNTLGDAVTINTNGSPASLSDMTHVEKSYTTTAQIDKGSTITFKIIAGTSGQTKNNRITNIAISAN